MKFTGSKVKKSRALGIALTPKAARLMRKRPNPPGMHGANRRRRKSEYAEQLTEKQRLRFQYNVTEKYMVKLYQKAQATPGPTGQNLIQLLETRLDAVVLRGGFAPTIYAARQMVGHGHVLLNGRKASISSQRVHIGDVVSIREKSRKSDLFAEVQAGRRSSSAYISVDASGMEARLDYLPERSEIPVICELNLVIEYYNR